MQNWMGVDVNNLEPTLVQVMAWCLTAPSHYLSHCLPIFLSSYGITRSSELSHLPYCHIYASVNQVSIGSDNGLSPIRRQAIIETNAEILSTGLTRTNSSEILIKIQNFSFTKMSLKISSAKWRPICPGRDEFEASPMLTYLTQVYWASAMLSWPTYNQCQVS